MGMMQHHSIVAVNWDPAEFEALQKWIPESEREFFLVGEPQRNGYRTVCLISDGSKEGWETSDRGDERRALFVEWMNSREYSDMSMSWKYIEVSFGEFGAMIVQSNTEE